MFYWVNTILYHINIRVVPFGNGGSCVVCKSKLYQEQSIFKFPYPIGIIKCKGYITNTQMVLKNETRHPVNNGCNRRWYQLCQTQVHTHHNVIVHRISSLHQTTSIVVTHYNFGIVWKKMVNVTSLYQALSLTHKYTHTHAHNAIFLVCNVTCL